MDTQLSFASIVDSLDIPGPPRPKPFFKTFETANTDVGRARPTGRLFYSLITLCVVFALILLQASCATLSEDERAQRRFDREDRLVLAREDYARRNAECKRSGGAMQITRRSASRFSRPTAHEYRMAACVTY